MRDLYRILGVPDNATIADIKAAYRRLAKLYHPDLNPGSRSSEEKFKEILDAYTILADEDLRAQYDRKRSSGFSAAFRTPPFQQQQEKKKAPPRKEYPPEYIEALRQRNRTRIVKQIQRRKKILRGMIITFGAYLIATAVFESWLSNKREEQSLELNNRMEAQRIKDSTDAVSNHGIQNLDSPYDSIFGPGQSTWLSPNQLVVINPHSDAVICLTRIDSPYVTIRNEFIHARKKFVMKDLPNGSYIVKVYTGENWDESVTVPGGRAFGGFSSNQKFFIVKRPPITLIKPTYNNRNTVTTDTVRIDTSGAKIRLITREEFFLN